ncbi:MAG: hypothetical protein P4L87_18165, partial [Formivibrio sp.]|nr:hypothetical protein [Formivibrio sp.]
MRALRRIFSFPVMLATLLVLLVVLTVRGRFDDPDLWWQLKMGQIIWTTHSIPAQDLFSYTTNHQALIPQEWLAEVTIYWAYLWGGYCGLMLWFCALASALVVAGYALCWLYSRNAKVAFAGAMLVWFFATIAFTIRPHMIAYVLMVAELLLIQTGRTRSPGWFWGLPILFVLWINCHGSFILGMIVAGVYLLSSLFDFQAGLLVSKRWEAHRRRTLTWALVVSAAGLLLNPAGIKQILYPFDTLMNMHILMANVEEWAPLRMTEARGIGLMAVLLCCF